VEIEIIPNPDIVSVQNVLNKIDTGIQTIPTEDTTIITEMIPVFPDSSKIGGVVNYPTAELIAAKVEQSNALDHFLATAWTPNKVSTMIDSMGLINNLFS
jgi:hypothetical protein